MKDLNLRNLQNASKTLLEIPSTPWEKILERIIKTYPQYKWERTSEKAIETNVYGFSVNFHIWKSRIHDNYYKYNLALEIESENCEHYLSMSSFDFTMIPDLMKACDFVKSYEDQCSLFPSSEEISKELKYQGDLTLEVDRKFFLKGSKIHARYSTVFKNNGVYVDSDRIETSSTSLSRIVKRFDIEGLEKAVKGKISRDQKQKEYDAKVKENEKIGRRLTYEYHNLYYRSSSDDSVRFELYIPMDKLEAFKNFLETIK